MTTPTSYENVPVFRNGMPMGDVRSYVGKADVEIHQEEETTVVTMRLGKAMTDFLKLGGLKSFGLNAMIGDVDADEARAWRELYDTAPKE